MAHPSSYHVIPALPEPDPDHSTTHRPVHFNDIIGQPRLIARLTTHLNSAVARGVQPGHVLLDGQAGLGKTTIGKAIATELADRGVASRFHEITGDSVPNINKLALELSALTEGDVLFVDEVQGLRPSVQQGLLTALEDGVLTVPGGTRSGAQRLTLPTFSLVGATTHPGKLSAPLRDRFALVGHVTPYSFESLTEVLRGHAERADIALTDEAAEIIARASRFTPRVAIKLLGAVRDYVIDLDPNAKIDADAALQGLEHADIDMYGLDDRDRWVLEQVATEFMGGPIGVAPLAASLGMDYSELTKDIEPYLLRSGLLRLQPRGRCATPATYTALGLPVPPLVNGLLK